MGFDWGGHGNDDFNWDLEVNYDFEVDVDMDFYTEVEYNSDYNADFQLELCVDIEGNFAGYNVDVQAIGDDGATEVNLAVITEDNYSSISVSGYSAVA